jgi:hypothetical protein
VGDHAQFLIDSADNLEGSESEYSQANVGLADRTESCFQTMDADKLRGNVLLLDSCSTVNLITNKDMIHDVRKAKSPMRVRCNAGIKSNSLQGTLGGFPEPVWYNPSGAANILSLNSVKKHYRVRYDSSKDDAFIVTHSDGREIIFKPTAKGLYALRKTDCNDVDDSGNWAFFNTVAEWKDKYTKREYKAAMQARKVQNIMMHPSSRQYMDISDKNQITNNPVLRAHIQAAEDIFGANLGSLKGKTVTRSGKAVEGRITGVPPEIKHKYQRVSMSIDIMFVNKIPFLITTSRGLHFGTVESIPNRQVPTVTQALKRVCAQYERRGFKVTVVQADPEFEPLQAELGHIQFNFCAQDEHVPDVERFIRTIKDRTRSCYNTLPFSRIPRLVIIRMVYNAVFWLNAFPHRDGASSTLSPRYILTGKQLDFAKHVRTEYGAYVQTHEQHTNDMNSRTLGAICLGPMGNEQGGHYFMSLASGRRIRRHRWTELPMPDDVVTRVTALGRLQGMPRTLTFGDRYGFEITDDTGSVVDDDHDSAYDPDDDSDGDDDDDLGDYPGGDDDDDDSDDDPPDHHHEPEGDDARAAGADEGINQPRLQQDEDNIDDDDDASDQQPGGSDPAEIAGVGNDSQDGNTDSNDAGVSGAQQGIPARAHYSLRPQKARNYDHSYNPKAFKRNDREHQMMIQGLVEATEAPMGDLFMTEQMSLKRGLKMFGKAGADALVAELQQIDYRECIKPTAASELTKQQKRDSLRYLMFLKQKRCGRIKGRGCADGRKQRVYKTKEETSSPTVSTEALFLTSIIDAHEGRQVITLDIPGAFMQSDMDELIHMKLEGAMAELLVRVDPKKYRKFVSKEHGKNVIYVELTKALYGTLQAALLFWENLSSFLVDELGFKINKYDKCVVNKTVDGKQCTIVWHVDDLKLSHVSSSVLEDIVGRIEGRYGKEAPLSVTRGKVHDYLGMTLDFSVDGKVTFSMNDYIENVLDDAPDDKAFAGTAATPAAHHLFDVSSSADKLPAEAMEKFHRTTAKLLYLCKRARPDLQTGVAFLCTRVKQPDTDDWKKLARVVRYLRGTKELNLTLEADGSGAIKWWIDASFAVHQDMRSHTGITMSLGKGSPFSASTRQRLNTKSSTEAELVGVDDGMSLITWVRRFMTEQGFVVNDNVVYQDNQSAMLLERNGRASSGRRTRHINIKYFFVSDRIKDGELRVEYCPTDDMWGDFFTKPLQGSKFRRQRAIILNIDERIPLPVTSIKSTGPQECVEVRSWADVVGRTDQLNLVQSPKSALMVAAGK